MSEKCEWYDIEWDFNEWAKTTHAWTEQGAMRYAQQLMDGRTSQPIPTGPIKIYHMVGDKYGYKMHSWNLVAMVIKHTTPPSVEIAPRTHT